MTGKSLSLITEDRSKPRKSLIFGGFVGGATLLGLGLNMVDSMEGGIFLLVIAGLSGALILGGLLIRDRKITVDQQGIRGETPEGNVNVKWNEVKEIRSFPGGKKMEIHLNDQVIPITMKKMFTPDALKLERAVRKFAEYDDHLEF